MHSDCQGELDKRATQKVGLGENIDPGFCKETTERIPYSTTIQWQKLTALGEENRSDANCANDIEVSWIGLDQPNAGTEGQGKQKDSGRWVVFKRNRETDKEGII